MSSPLKAKKLVTADAITTDQVALAVSRGLRRRFGEMRSAVKLIAQSSGFDPATVKGWFEARNPPHAAALVKLMRDCDEVCEELLRLSGRPDEAETARLRAAVSAIEGALGRFGGRG